MRSLKKQDRGGWAVSGHVSLGPTWSEGGRTYSCQGLGPGASSKRGQSLRLVTVSTLAVSLPGSRGQSPGYEPAHYLALVVDPRWYLGPCSQVQPLQGSAQVEAAQHHVALG